MFLGSWNNVQACVQALMISNLSKNTAVKLNFLHSLFPAKNNFRRERHLLGYLWVAKVNITNFGYFDILKIEKIKPFVVFLQYFMI